MGQTVKGESWDLFVMGGRWRGAAQDGPGRSSSGDCGQLGGEMMLVDCI